MASTEAEPEAEPRPSRREQRDAARAEARRVLALSQIRAYPDAALRQPATPVTEFGADLKALVERMERVMDDAHGVGLAGPQLGLARRVFVFRRGEGDELQPVVNPEIVERGEETAVDEEGCLSLGPLRIPVERSTTVTVEAQDVRGEPLRLELEGLDARVAQHEIDHLDGVLIIDRTTDEARSAALAALRPEPGPRPGA